MSDVEFDVDPRHWAKRLTLAQAERKVLGPRNRRHEIVPVYVDIWDALVAQMLQGDELWFYETPQEDRGKVGYSAGVVLVRAATPVAQIPTVMC